MSTASPTSFARLPGGEFVAEGLADLTSGRESVSALVLAIAAQRLAAADLPLPAPIPRDAELRLYRSLRAIHGDDAHSQFNACLRRLAGLCHALETSHSLQAISPLQPCNRSHPRGLTKS